MPRPPLSTLILALLASLTLAGCAAEQPGTLGARSGAPAPPIVGGPGTTAPGGYTYVAPPPQERRPIPESPLGEGRIRDQAGLAAACNQQADNTLRQRDRSEIMREDERDSRQGTFSSPYQFRAPLDQMGRRFERDQIARDCVLRNTRGTPDR